MSVHDLVYASPLAAIALVCGLLRSRGRVGFFDVLKVWLLGRNEVASQTERTHAIVEILDHLPPGSTVIDRNSGLSITVPLSPEATTKIMARQARKTQSPNRLPQGR